MFIKRVSLKSFGKTSGTCDFSTTRCNVICQENETGKSTLVDAILYAFYNFPGSGKRGELRPKDKYRPWFPANGRKFEVEIEISDCDGRNFILSANFAKPQPFELIDADTRKTVPLEGESFGRKYFRMQMQTFTDCFLFRQDERETGERDELIQAIEKAAVSNRKNQDSSIRNALNTLADARLHYEEFSAGPVTVDNLLKCIDKKLASATNEYSTRRQARDEKAREIESACAMDAEIASLEETEASLDKLIMHTELDEIDSVLERQQVLLAQISQRQERLSELARYAHYDLALRPEVQNLYTEWGSVQKQLQDSRIQLDDRILEPLRRVERDIATFPETVSSLTRSDFERLRSLRITFAEQNEEIREQSLHCKSLRQELSEQGVPIEDSDEVQHHLSSLSPADCKVLLDFENQQLALDSALAEVEQKSAEASSQVVHTKGRRERLRMISSLWFVGTILMALVGLLFLLMKFIWLPAVWIAAVSFLSAVGCAAIGFLYRHRTQQHSVMELEPAMAAEISLTSEINRVREKLTTLRDQLADTLKKRGLELNDLKLIKQMASWTQMLAPYRASHEYLTRLELSHNGVLNEIKRLIAPLSLRNFTTLSDSVIDTAIHQIEHILQAHEERDHLNDEGERLLQEIEQLQDRMEICETRLHDMIAAYAPPEEDLVTQVETFLVGCENAIRLTELSRSSSDAEILPAEKVQELESRRNEILSSAGSNFNFNVENSTTEPLSKLREKRKAVSASREQLRIQRMDRFFECDKVIEEWRKTGTELEAEIARLENFRATICDFKEALAIAEQELNSIAEQVFTKWAAAINVRASEILADFQSVYREIEFSDNLEVSVFSAEADRRLNSREFQHLSKGARDQLNFAVRIAVSEYLSSHAGNLPLIFDEPFAHWDDSRFVEGMRFLAKLAERHQVIVLSCHGWRYQELARTNPEIAAMLNSCSVQPLVLESAIS